MSSSSDSDLSVVKTYVPEYQKNNWKEHADELDMSQSEFVRTMVQSGRRGFLVDDTESRQNPEEGGSSDGTPGVDGLETRILDALETEPRSWDELLEEIAGDLEADLDDTLQQLQADGRIRYSGRNGGYELVDR